MTAQKISELQNIVAARAKQNPDLDKITERRHSPTLHLALAEVGFELADLRARSVQNIDRLASLHLGISRTHCALIRVADWYNPYGGIGYLDFSLSKAGPAATSLRNLWFHFDTLAYDSWRAITTTMDAAPAGWRPAWIRASQLASIVAPEAFYLAGEATLEVSHEPALDVVAACVRAKHRATIEVIASGSGEDIAFNHLRAFGFDTPGAIPGPSRGS